MADELDGFYLDFPALTGRPVRKTSEATEDYNCFAFAAGSEKVRWGPAIDYHWPDEVPRTDTLDAFIQAYGTLGYVIGAEATIEIGTEKVALYALNGKPKHAALQLVSGSWKSKIGGSIDIEHELSDLEGPLYGTVAAILWRRRSAP